MFWFALLFLAGMLLAGAALAAPWPALLGVGLGAGISVLWFARRGRKVPAQLRPLPWALAVLALGALRYQAAQPQITPAHIAYYNDSDSEWAVTAVLTRLPDERDSYSQLWLQVESIRDPDGFQHLPVSGRLLARVPTDGDWQYGDRLILRGELVTPPEDETFSYRAYLAQRQVFAYMPFAEAARLESGAGHPLLAALYAVKARALALTGRFWPQPESSLLAGILLGVESGIPADVEAAFNRTGTSHVIAISGSTSPSWPDCW